MTIAFGREFQVLTTLFTKKLSLTVAQEQKLFLIRELKDSLCKFRLELSIFVIESRFCRHHDSKNKISHHDSSITISIKIVMESWLNEKIKTIEKNINFWKFHCSYRLNRLWGIRKSRSRIQRIYRQGSIRC